ncbi:MAG TPA: MerR family transcriptional regulator [Myxococcales bacterium]|nr:MerR family transcriptional regulator [Myxococcales bacterium]HIK84891.1 MerR family transcriptional regulator [Myxococcales bacterium]
MEYRVAELAVAAGIAVDTVRFYQARGLISAPERRGRFAIYDAGHLERIRRIRALLESGFSLAQIRSLLDAESESENQVAAKRASDRGLLEALAEKSVGAGTVSRSELATQTGVPEALIGSAIQAGLIAPIEVNGVQRFTRTDLEMVSSALEILDMGLPLDRLLEMAAFHAAHVDALAEQAIDLFDDFVRKPNSDPDPDADSPGGAAADDDPHATEQEEAVRKVFERLLPQTTQIVALHFQRTVVSRALARLRGQGDSAALEMALEATQSARLEVQWR